MNEIKTVALYLPQYHCLPENDQWWGKGFTDWTAAKAAKPLFEGHHQPREPLGDNYYNLLDEKTMQWQADLAREYHVDGFCFYHYWFKDGRRILEKPAENLLGWTDVDMPFCFCWANESWVRSWGAVAEANPWADKFEPQEKSAGSGVLLKQEYGDKDDWENHFQYLLPFFRDERYICVDGKPVLVIYRPELIACLDDMIKCWRILADSAGLLGIYLVGMDTGGKQMYRDMESFDSVISIMPKTNPAYVKWLGSLQIHGMDYQACWEDYLLAHPVPGKKTLWCGIVDYDATPRRGEKGTVYLGASPERFGQYYAKLVQKSIRMGNPLVFINAWNEWGEGMYLEPDKEHGYAYLQAVKDAMEGKVETESVIDYDGVIRRRDIRIAQLEARLDKFRQYYDLMHRWMLLHERGESVEEYFLAHGYGHVLLYGYGNHGRHLVADLQSDSVCIVGAIDQNRARIQTDIPLYGLDEELPDCDIVVVTVIHEYSRIQLLLAGKVKCPIVSLAEIV